MPDQERLARETQDGRRQPSGAPMVPEAAESAPPAGGPAGWPAHPAAGSLRRTAVLRLQRSHGNARVARALARQMAARQSAAPARSAAPTLRRAPTEAVVHRRIDPPLTEAQLAAVPAGGIREATAALGASAETVDNNTARRLVNGDITAGYIEDLTQPPNVDTLVRSYGRDPAQFTLYYHPGSTTQTMWVQVNAQGFRMVGFNRIFGRRALSVERWRTLLVHETNHARNVDPSTPLQNYQSEFRAYWVAEFRGVSDLDERARQIKAHVLRDYPLIRAAYDADEVVRRAIDGHTRPDGNITNT